MPLVEYWVEVPCSECGVILQASTRRRRLCGDCRVKRSRAAVKRRLRERPRTMYMINCENCGATEQRRRETRWCTTCRSLGETHPRPEVAAIVKNREPLSRIYGLTINQWIALAEAQNWRCALCPVESSVDNLLHVDHCHSTGKVRGLLCKQCNLAVGRLGDTAEALQRVADYLWRSS